MNQIRHIMKRRVRHQLINRQVDGGRRAGFMIIEVLVAAVLLGVAATLCLQILTVAAKARRISDQQRLATREASNLMERLMAGSDEQLAAAPQEPPSLRPEVAGALRDAKVEIRLVPETKEPKATRIMLTLTWRPYTGRPRRSVQLVAWRYSSKANKAAPSSSSDLPPTTKEGPKP